MLTSIEVWNDSDKAVILSPYTPLGCIVEYKADSYFKISSDLVFRAGKLKFRCSWVKLTFQTLLLISAAYHVNFSTTVKSEQQLLNSITVYRKTTNAVTALTEIVSHYSNLWEDNSNVADILKDEWMKISLLNNWQELYKSEQVKVYSLSTKDCELVNEVFDKLHQQDCMIWMTQLTSFTYLCFVVWKTTSTEQKGWLVVNIWALNWIMMPDTYSVLSQADIFAVVQGADFISTVNCASFFYQWRVKLQNCHKLTVSSYHS